MGFTAFQRPTLGLSGSETLFQRGLEGFSISHFPLRRDECVEVNTHNFIYAWMFNYLENSILLSIAKLILRSTITVRKQFGG